MSFGSVSSYLLENVIGIIGILLTVWFSISPRVKKWITAKQETNTKEEANLAANLAIASDVNRSTFFLHKLIKIAVKTILWAIWGAAWLILSFMTISFPRDSYAALFIFFLACWSIGKCLRDFKDASRNYFRPYLETNPNDIEQPAENPQDIEPVVNQE